MTRRIQDSLRSDQKWEDTHSGDTLHHSFIDKLLNHLLASGRRVKSIKISKGETSTNFKAMVILCGRYEKVVDGKGFLQQ